MEPNGSFSYHARFILLTYPQCEGLDEWHVLDHITGMGAECIIARESHADGHPHLHVFLDFGRIRRGRRHDIFDVDGFHANINPSRGKPWCGWDYATKDGDVVAGGLGRPLETQSSATADKWSQIVEAPDRDRFFELVRLLDPKALVCNHANVVKFADWQYRAEPEPYCTPAGVGFDTSEVAGLSEWADANIGTGLGR